MSIHVGTSGWHYPTGQGTWNGVFYPSRRPRHFDELAYYAEFFDTVEVNSTFYRMPEAALSQAWLGRTPSSFLFAVKLYQKFTHPDMYLARPGATNWDVSAADLDLFRLGIAPLAEAGRLAAILLQFPPSFHAEPDTRDYLDWLGTALGEYPLAVELRHRSWTDSEPDTRRRLAAHRLAWVHTDEPSVADGHPVGADAVEGTTIAYVRLHGRNAATWWSHDEAEDRYNYLYSRGELAPVADRARALSAAGRRVLIYGNNHFSAKAVANAAVLKHELGELVPGLYPREMIARYPDLDGIVSTAGLPI
jgi:uncharacterized protein YecE (DUF72 family)